MKNLIIVIIATFFVNISFAQNRVIEQFYDKYTKLENVTEIDISGGLLNMVASFSDDADTKILEKVSKLRILAIDDQSVIDTQDKKALVKGLRSSKFEELMQIRDGKSKIDFMVRESNNKITNILMMVDDEDSFFMLSLEGNISWKDIEKLDINVDGAEHLKKMPKA